jgi:hypothetical protein
LAKLAKGTHGGGGKIKIKLYTYNLFKIKYPNLPMGGLQKEEGPEYFIIKFALFKLLFGFLLTAQLSSIVAASFLTTTTTKA